MILRATLGFIVAVSIATPAVAQSSGSITGTVEDVSGGVFVFAEIPA